MGQLGILVSLCVCAYHKNVRFVDLLNSNLSAGNFYTFSISLIAAAIVPFLIEYLEKKGDVKFKHFKIVTSVIIVVILMIPMIGFYTVVVSDTTVSPSTVPNSQIDWLQLIFYLFTMGGCVYAFCVSNLDRDYESYAELDNAEVIRLKKSVPKTGGEDSRKNEL